MIMRTKNQRVSGFVDVELTFQVQQPNSCKFFFLLDYIDCQLDLDGIIYVKFFPLAERFFFEERFFRIFEIPNGIVSHRKCVVMLVV